MKIGTNLSLAHFRAEIAGYRIEFDGHGMRVERIHPEDETSSTPLAPKQAEALLDALAATIAGKTFGALALEVSTPTVEAFTPPVAADATISEAEAAESFGDPQVDPEEATADLKEPVAAKPKTSRTRRTRKAASAIDDAMTPPEEDKPKRTRRTRKAAPVEAAPVEAAPVEAAPVEATDAPPASVVAMKRVKEVVAYYLNEGLDPEGVWAACAPHVEAIPALARLRDAEARVKRVATVYYEG